MIRVLVVDDSPTVRAMIAAVLQSDPAITIVGQAGDGAQALAMVEQLRPDLVTLDLQMPVMDGLATTRAIMAAHPTPIILMTGSSVKEDVALSFEALRSGALAITDKPSPGSESLAAQWGRLVDMVKALADVRVVRHRTANGVSPARGRPTVARPSIRARIIGVGASAGGPKAVRDLLVSLPSSLSIPVLVVQHIAPGFTSGFAEWLEREMGSSRKIVVAQQGIVPRDHCVYLAPDREHLGLTAGGSIQLSDAPLVGGFRPSATFLFASLAQVLGSAAIGVILTGMGSDGVDGLRALHAAGGTVIAQDEDSSLVYGMPGAAEAAGIVQASLHPADMGPYIASILEEARVTL
ncbi:MAG TPA: chemotaxis-specific protein-glutamate methyltransferase CheB [Gemmatimonadaceae bacterium]|nr:chemotaxis-specific protein-glutamate methyltransferase CheB [Gemmatimonadaceae bacterium]